eukprot:7959118-Alexandrium_andersonii.AAC.1
MAASPLALAGGRAARQEPEMVARERLDAGHLIDAVHLAKVTLPLVGLHRARGAPVGPEDAEAAELTLPPQAARGRAFRETSERGEAAVRQRR